MSNFSTQVNYINKKTMSVLGHEKENKFSFIQHDDDDSMKRPDVDEYLRFEFLKFLAYYIFFFNMYAMAGLVRMGPKRGSIFGNRGRFESSLGVFNLMTLRNPLTTEVRSMVMLISFNGGKKDPLSKECHGLRVTGG